MYIISNEDMKHIIEYIELMKENLQGDGLRIQTKKWMADNLLQKLRRKQQFSTSDLPEIKHFIR